MAKDDAANNNEDMESMQPNAWLSAGLVLVVVLGTGTLGQIQGERKHIWQSERRCTLTTVQDGAMQY
jgi:hypothetical protein